MKNTFKIGAFIDIKTGTATEAKQEIDFVDSLPGLQHVEIWREADRLEPEAEKMIRSLKNRYQIIIHAPFINVNFAGHQLVNKASVNLMQEFYDWSLDIGAEVLTIHGGHYPFFQTTNQTIDLIIENLSNLRLSPTLKCTLENMPASKSFSTGKASLHNLIDLTSAVNQLPNFGFTLDIGHVLQNSESWEDWALANLDRIYNIHLHDAFLGGKAHLELGTADLNCQHLFDFLNKNNYNKFVSSEVVDKERIKRSWEYMQNNNLI